VARPVIFICDNPTSGVGFSPQIMHSEARLTDLGPGAPPAVPSPGNSNTSTLHRRGHTTSSAKTSFQTVPIADQLLSEAPEAIRGGIDIPCS